MMQSRPRQRALRHKGEGLDRPPNRFVLVFEGALGLLDQLSEPEFERLMKIREYEAALSLWQLNDFVVRILWDRVMRYSQSYYVVSYLTDDDLFAQALAAKLGGEEVPVRICWAQQPAVFSRHLITMPDIIRVYDPDPGRAGLYPAAVGRILTDATMIGVV